MDTIAVETVCDFLQVRLFERGEYFFLVSESEGVLLGTAVSCPIHSTTPVDCMSPCLCHMQLSVILHMLVYSTKCIHVRTVLVCLCGCWWVGHAVRLFTMLAVWCEKGACVGIQPCALFVGCTYV